MLITSVTIRNFLCYYGENTFLLADGLTLLIGDNGDGKTTFFDALKWLLNTQNTRARLDLFSAMRKKELAIGESDVLSVSMAFEHNGEKSVEKSFKITRTGKGPDDFSVSEFSYIGKETLGTDRIKRPGDELINRCYDAFMQKFSMFQGESQLDVLNDETSFKRLIEEFSNLKDFETFVSYTEDFSKKSFRALKQERENDSKTAAEAKRIGGEIKNAEDKAAQYRSDVKRYSDSAQQYKKRLDSLEKNQESSEKLRDVNSRIDNLRKKLSMHKDLRYSVNLNTSLLDKMWILCAFPDILSDFQKKCADYDQQERLVEKEWIKKKTAERVKKETLAEIKAITHHGELRWDIPDRQTMEQMIEAKRCWVCGHPAPVGSDEYNYMVQRLEEYKKKISPIEPESQKEESCFENSFVPELHTMSIRMDGLEAQAVSRKSSDITERLELEVKLDGIIVDLEKQIEELDAERSRIVTQSNGQSEDTLEKNFNDYMGFNKLYKQALDDLHDAEDDLKRETDRLADLKKQLAELPGTGMVEVYNRVNQCFEKIFNAFKGAKEANLTQFLADLETVANAYLDKLNLEDFHGVVHLRQSVNSNGEVVAAIELRSEDGSIVHHPSGSQETTMYMSVLFAISELTTKERKENYPLFFDAPTSTFDSTKIESFYNVVDSLDKQCIITTKDFVLPNGDLNEKALDKLTCRVYRLKKDAGFARGALETIKTTVTVRKN